MNRFLIACIAALLSTSLLTACKPQDSANTQTSTQTEVSSEASPSTSSDTSAQAASYQTFSADEAKQLMNSSSDYVIVDVRTESEFSGGHIPDALNIPVDTITSSGVAELPNKDQLIFVYCQSGGRATTASEQLVQLGYTNVVNMGGISSWTGDIVS